MASIPSLSTPIAPPRAKRVPVTTAIHGDIRIDDYAWLRDRDDPETLRFLEDENDYAAEIMKTAGGLQEQIYQELISRILENDLSVPERIDNYYYYTRTVEGLQYSVHCRKEGSLESAEAVILDQNQLAAGHSHFRLGAFKPSPDHRLLAYSTDTDGSETYTLFIARLDTGELFPESITNTYYGVEWAGDSETIFYITLDAAKRPFQLYRHKLRTDPAADVLIYREDDEMFLVELAKTRSRKYLLLSLTSKMTSEVRYLEADRPTGVFGLIHPRQHGVEYSVEHHGDSFFIVTNEQARNFKLMEAPAGDPAKANWRELIPHREGVKLDSVDAFARHLVICERELGLPKVSVRALPGGELQPIAFSEPVYAVSPAGNPEFDTNLLRFHYTSLVTPRSVFDYDMNAGTRELKKQYEVRGGYDPSQYESERIFAAAPDGVAVPVSLVYRKGLALNGANPLLLYGYGAYGLSMDPGFSSDRLSLLDRGVIYAVAHIRGGGEMGRGWYEQGRLLHKRNTFTDFIACAGHLIARGYTSGRRLAIYGGSAGGLLIGAVLNLRSELFHAAIARVPFVDVVNTMLDETIPLTVTEFEEWGNPKDRAYYEYIKSYSPYDNVTAKAYPHLLILAGLNDPRVAYWEPAKWAAKLRSLKTDGNILLLKTNLGAGHGGASGRYDRLRETALEYAFLLSALQTERT